MSTNQANEKAPMRLKLGYAMGEIGTQSIWYMINSYLMLFYTDVLSISAGAISMIMLIARIWDAVNDPMMGVIADRTNTKWGKFRPYLMYTPPLLAIFNILTFTVLPVTGAAKVVLALIFYIGAGMTYTVCVTAYASIVNVIVKKSHTRQNLLAWRQSGNAIAQIILSAIAMPLILKLGNSDVANAKGFFWGAVVLSVFSVPCIWITAATCKETYGQELHQETGEKKSVMKSLKLLVKNDQLMLTIVFCLGMSLSIMGRMTLLSYYIIYVLGAYNLIGPVYGIMSVASLIASFFIAPGTKKFGKKGLTIIMNAIMVAGLLLLYFMPGASVPMIMVFSFCVGVGSAGQGVIFGMVSDCIDYGEMKFGTREEGVCSSLISFSAKLATAIVGAGGIVILMKAGYVPNAEQTEAAKQGINLVVNLVPAICVIVSTILLYFYKLSNKKVAEISTELEQRRSAN